MKKDIHRHDELIKRLFFVIAIIVLLFFFLTDKPISGTGQWDIYTNKEEAAAAEKTILPFKTLNKKKVGLNSQNRATQKIMVQTESLPTEDVLKNTGISVWKNNSNYDEFTVFIYLEGMDTNYNAYCIIEFNSRKMTDFMILESTLMDTKWENLN